MITALSAQGAQPVEPPLTEERLVSIYQQLADYQPCFTPSSVDVVSFTEAVPSSSGRAVKRMTIFDYLLKYGHDEDFDPNVDCPPFPATGARPGTLEKRTVLAQRVMQGLPLWHGNDPVDYRGLVGDLRALFDANEERGHSEQDDSLDCQMFPSRL